MLNHVFQFSFNGLNYIEYTFVKVVWTVWNYLHYSSRVVQTVWAILKLSVQSSFDGLNYVETLFIEVVWTVWNYLEIQFHSSWNGLSYVEIVGSK